MERQKGVLGGRKAVVTGAASGIGKAVVEAFVAEGATVLGVDLPSDGWQSGDAVENGVARLAIDITGDDAPARIVEAAAGLLGGIDILVNNAGISTFGGADTATDEQWDRIIAINVTAVFRLTREAVPHLKQSGSGRVINTGSIMSELAGPQIIGYVTSKHAVAGMTKAMAVDLGPFGIRANFIQPGAVDTALSAPFMSDPDFLNYWERKIPLGRIAQPGDIAPAVVFLASEAAAYVSGEGLRVDGGACYNS
jgi:NAD(P)-dependent dehydrogenase (short-subunit alcohol dehydrogenase family)